VRLVDTNIVSYVFKNHSISKRYRRHLIGHSLAISFMTLAELDEWALSAGWGPKRRGALDAFLQTYLVVHSDPDLCQRWADVRFERRNQPIAVPDAWIAATALVHQVELVTHDPGDFQGISGLNVISEAP
jgi:tRNA(fMet)-specific endonuclease VapC